MPNSNVTPIKKADEATKIAAEPVAKRDRQIRSKAMPSGLRLDLGCGPACTPGFVGVDRFSLPGVSVVTDLDGPLPFETETVDYVLASHSLEHIVDLPATMAEINRICRDRAIITIIGPYHSTGLNRANVYHSQVFNEHTMRFFTGQSDNAHIDHAEYEFPHADVWGLLGSDHSEHEYDIRVLKQQFFYFAPFRGLSQELKTVFRKTLNDVCDQMVVHAVIAKSPMGADEEAAILRNTQFAETESLRYRRQLEQQEGQPSIWSALSQTPAELAELEKRHGLLEQQLVSLAESANRTGSGLESLGLEARQQIAKLEIAQTDLQADAQRVAVALRKERNFSETRTGELAVQLDSVREVLGNNAAVHSSRLESYRANFEEIAKQQNTRLESQTEKLAAALREALSNNKAEHSSRLESYQASLHANLEEITKQQNTRLEQTHLDLRSQTEKLAETMQGDLTIRDAKVDELASQIIAVGDGLSILHTAQDEWRAIGEGQQVNVENNIRGLSDSHGSLTTRISDLEGQVTGLTQVSQDRAVRNARKIVNEGINPSLRHRAKRYLRQFRTDLSRQIAPGNQRLLQDSLVDNNITHRYQLLLSSFLVDGMVLDFILPNLTAPLLSMDTVFNILVPIQSDGLRLGFDVYDKSNSCVVHSGALEIGSISGEAQVRLDLSGLATRTGDKLILRLFGSAMTQRHGLRTYEWRRRRLTPFGRPVERKLFGSYETAGC